MGGVRRGGKSERKGSKGGGRRKVRWRKRERGSKGGGEVGGEERRKRETN